MKPINRFWLFIYSTPNIVGSILGIVGLTLFFLGFIKSFWFLIVAGLYLAGYIGWPRSEKLSLKMNADMQTGMIEKELQKLVANISNKVLPETLEKVQSIAALVIDLLPRVSKEPQQRHVLVQTATDYLPNMLEHYLNLPPTFARFHPLKNGMTPRQILIEQLVLIEEQLKAMALNIHKGDTNALLAHSNFLKSKFEKDTTWEL